MEVPGQQNGSPGALIYLLAPFFLHPLIHPLCFNTGLITEPHPEQHLPQKESRLIHVKDEQQVRSTRAPGSRQALSHARLRERGRFYWLSG